MIAPPPVPLGELRLHPAFRSAILGNERTLRVWLPPGYDRKRKYPTVWLMDGQNVFDGATAYIKGNEWRADETAASLMGAGLMPRAILVGVDNAGAARADEYLPTRVMRGGTSMGGGAEKFHMFLTKEAMPFVARTYGTLPGSQHTTLVGSSFGGVLALSLGLRHPDVYGRIAAMSPSVWWDERSLLKLAASSRQRGQRIWTDAGTDEEDRTVPDVRDLGVALRKLGFRDGVDLAVYVVEGDRHDEPAWSRRLPAALQFLFRR